MSEMITLKQQSWIQNFIETLKTNRNAQTMLVLLLGMIVAAIGGALIGITGQGIWIILGTIGAGAGMMMVLRPGFGVIVLVAFIFLNLSDVIEVTFGIPSLNKLLIALIFVGVLGTRIVIQKRPIIFRNTEGLFLLYGMVMVTSSYFSNFPETAFSHIIDFVKDYVIVIILVQVCDNERVWKSIIWTVIIGAAFLSTLSSYQMLTGDTENTFFGLANAPKHEIVAGFDNTRPTGPLEDPNFYAQILLMILPMATYRLIGEKGWVRGVALYCTGIIVLCVIFTYSRSAFLMMMGITFFIILERKLNVYKIFGMGAIILALVMPILPAGYLDRIGTITGSSELAQRGQTEMSFQGRNSEMIVAIEMFLDHPLIGIGYASYDKNYQSYSRRLGMDMRTEERETHSLYLEIAAETGVAGIIVFGLFMFAVFKSMHDAREKLKKIARHDLIPWVWGLQFGLMSYLMTSIFLHDGYVRYLRLSIALAVSATALVDALMHQKEQEEKTKKGIA
jgi:putative inorganic carbon (hco3(-)) transporter